MAPLVEPGTGDVVTADKTVTLPETIAPVAEPHTGESDTHVPGEVVVHVENLPKPLTAKEYRDKGYAISPAIADDDIVTSVPSDGYGDPGTVTLVDGTTVSGSDIPTASALQSRIEAKTPDEVTAEAVAKVDDEATVDDIVVDTQPTVPEVIQDQSDKVAKRGRPKGSSTKD